MINTCERRQSVNSFTAHLLSSSQIKDVLFILCRAAKLFCMLSASFCQDSIAFYAIILLTMKGSQVCQKEWLQFTLFLTACNCRVCWSSVLIIFLALFIRMKWIYSKYWWVAPIQMQHSESWLYIEKKTLQRFSEYHSVFWFKKRANTFLCCKKKTCPQSM